MGAVLRIISCDVSQLLHCPLLFDFFHRRVANLDVESGTMSRNPVIENHQKKELIKSMIEQAQVKRICESMHVIKKENFEQTCTAPRLELECDGTIYSGKLGSLFEYANSSDECKGEVAQLEGTNTFSQRKVVQHIGSDGSYSNICNYTIQQVEQILTNVKIENEYLINLKHENIIKYFGIFCEEDKLPILVMESIQCDLYEYLTINRKIAWNDVFAILQGISKALFYLHNDKNMAHCRVCTKSIVLTKGIVAKLTNFELAVVNRNDDKFFDVFCLGEVMVNVIQCAKFNETPLHLLFQSLHKFAEECLVKENRPSSSTVLNTIENYRHQYESIGDGSYNDSSSGHYAGDLERLTNENKQLKSQVEELQDKAKCMERKLLEIEERNFKLTNTFTTADSRSPLKISEEYRHIQHHYRGAAARAHRKIYGECSPVPFHEHTMIAYRKATELILTAFKQHIEKSLFDLHYQPNESYDLENVRDLRGVKLMMDKLYDDHSITTESVEAIELVLTKAYLEHINQQDYIPAEVKGYYSRLAKLIWNAVAKAIPMVLSTEPIYYDEAVHEPKDEPDDLDPSATSKLKVEYIYLILYTSNNHPREVALKGKVKILIN